MSVKYRPKWGPTHFCQDECVPLARKCGRHLNFFLIAESKGSLPGHRGQNIFGQLFVLEYLAIFKNIFQHLWMKFFYFMFLQIVFLKLFVIYARNWFIKLAPGCRGHVAVVHRDEAAADGREESADEAAEPLSGGLHRPQAHHQVSV
jgi:hypothetical protein